MKLLATSFLVRLQLDNLKSYQILFFVVFFLFFYKKETYQVKF